MMHFTLDDNSTFHLPNPNDPFYQLERQVDQLDKFPSAKRLALLYNDANNYKMASLSPTSEWFTKRMRWIQTYASLDWLNLGQHLNRESTMLGNLCTTIHQQLQTLSATPDVSSFPIAAFCDVLGQIDYLWQIVLPSQLKGIEHPTVLTLLKEFGQRLSSS